MARSFDFSEHVRNAAWFRQNGLCAVCGEDLRALEEFGHHVIPDQSGDPKSDADQFLRGVDNCVMLCADCHWAVHAGGLYAVGALPPPEYYRFSHTDARALAEWAAVVRREYLRVFDRVRAKTPAPT